MKKSRLREQESEPLGEQPGRENKGDVIASTTSFPIFIKANLENGVKKQHLINQLVRMSQIVPSF